jgi:hypothetical protein
MSSCWKRLPCTGVRCTLVATKCSKICKLYHEACITSQTETHLCGGTKDVGVVLLEAVPAGEAVKGTGVFVAVQCPEVR